MHRENTYESHVLGDFVHFARGCGVLTIGAVFIHKNLHGSAHNVIILDITVCPDPKLSDSLDAVVKFQFE